MDLRSLRTQFFADNVAFGADAVCRQSCRRSTWYPDFITSSRGRNYADHRAVGLWLLDRRRWDLSPDQPGRNDLARICGRDIQGLIPPRHRRPEVVAHRIPGLSNARASAA